MNKIIMFTTNLPTVRAAQFGSEHGTHNGYIAVPKGHPLHGMHYQDNNFPNLCEEITFTDYWFSKISPEIEVLTIDGSVLPDLWGYWVIGFDTMHYYNNSNHNYEWVISRLYEIMKEIQNLTI